MDGRRTLRPKGTDGNDYKYRQRVAPKYEMLATIMNQLHKLRIPHAAFASLSLLCALISLDFSNLDFSQIAYIIYTIILIATTPIVTMNQHVDSAALSASPLIFLFIGISSLVLAFNRLSSTNSLIGILTFVSHVGMTAVGAFGTIKTRQYLQATNSKR